MSLCPCDRNCSKCDCSWLAGGLTAQQPSAITAWLPVCCTTFSSSIQEQYIFLFLFYLWLSQWCCWRLWLQYLRLQGCIPVCHGFHSSKMCSLGVATVFFPRDGSVRVNVCLSSRASAINWQLVPGKTCLRPQTVSSTMSSPKKELIHLTWLVNSH